MGESVPPFSLSDINGREVSLDRILEKNDVVILNFWTTWCGPCRLEMPQLERLYQELSESGLGIVAINVGEGVDRVRSYLAEKPVSFTVLLDEDELVSAEYGVRAFPTTVVLDAQGKVQRSSTGLQPYLSTLVGEMLGREQRNE